mmetsp:Transcript_33232/g.82918  ORF Transcript_33232/g.82918 Transcript_33232/m.82918 type:complete len:152 (+) Transcript_33232:394-849(+)
MRARFPSAPSHPFDNARAVKDVLASETDALLNDILETDGALVRFRSPRAVRPACLAPAALPASASTGCVVVAAAMLAVVTACKGAVASRVNVAAITRTLSTAARPASATAATTATVGMECAPLSAPPGKVSCCRMEIVDCTTCEKLVRLER